MTAGRAFPEKAAALLLGLACAAGAVAGAAEEYPALAATEVAVFLAGAVALLRAYSRNGTGGSFPTRDTMLAGCALGAFLLVVVLQIVFPAPRGLPAAPLAPTNSVLASGALQEPVREAASNVEPPFPIRSVAG